MINDLYTRLEGHRPLAGGPRLEDQCWSRPKRAKSRRSAAEPCNSGRPCRPKPGKYQWVAELTGAGQKPVQSLRDFTAVPPAEWREEIARGKPVTSFVERDRTATRPIRPPRPWTATCGLAGCRRLPTRNGLPSTWAGRSKYLPRRPDLAVARQQVIRSRSRWMARTWKDVVRYGGGQGGPETIRFSPAEARWVRMLG